LAAAGDTEARTRPATARFPSRFLRIIGGAP
jgi:hypothetical protein